MPWPGADRLLARAVRCLVLSAILAAGGCAAPAPPSCPWRTPPEDLVYIRSHDWHVDIGLAAGSITGPLTVFRDVFPGAQAVMFGYGKRTFMTAPPDTFSEYLLGPLPGPAVVQVTGVGSLPTDAYDPGDVLVYRLPPGGARALSDFIWNDIAKDVAGGPRLIARGGFPGNLLYAAVSGYSLAHTCNTWAADALHAAGLALDVDGVMFSGQVVARAIGAGACEAGPQAP